MNVNSKLVTPRVRRLVLRALDLIDKNPKEYDQTVCRSMNEMKRCKSPNCIGGWIVIAAGIKTTAGVTAIVNTLWPGVSREKKPELREKLANAVAKFYHFYSWPFKFRNGVRFRPSNDSFRRQLPTPTARRARARMMHWLATDGKE